MYLYVEMFDGWGAFEDAQLGCNRPGSRMRIVKLELTDKQIEQIKPRKVGNIGAKEIFESANPVCFQED